MKVLLDEDVPHLLRNELTGHDVSTVAFVGWSGMKNGVLLGLAADADFEVFLTCDRNLQHQQNIPALGLAVVVLDVRDTRLETILPLVADILAVLGDDLRPGTVSTVGSWRTSDQ